VRFATDPRQPVAELMTKDKLVTVREGVGQDEAKRLLHQHRIEKLLVVDEPIAASASSPSRTSRRRSPSQRLQGRARAPARRRRHRVGDTASSARRC
jgi:CBS-domain-containing membrane protein